MDKFAQYEAHESRDVSSIARLCREVLHGDETAGSIETKLELVCAYARRLAERQSNV